MTPEQRSLARQALGLPNAGKCSFRNAFLTGDRMPDHAAWAAMVEAGYAVKHPAGALPSGPASVFTLTPIGARLAIEPRERLRPQDVPPEAAP